MPALHFFSLSWHQLHVLSAPTNTICKVLPYMTLLRVGSWTADCWEPVLFLGPDLRVQTYCKPRHRRRVSNCKRANVCVFAAISVYIGSLPHRTMSKKRRGRGVQLVLKSLSPTIRSIRPSEIKQKKII